MIVSMLVVTMLVVMTMGLLASGLHLQAATARDLRWNRAVQVAEAGVDQAVYHLASDPDYARAGPVTGSVPGGTYTVSVQRPAPGWIVVTSTGEAGGVRRRIQVTYGPAAVFTYALFSDTGLVVKNNNATTGDVFANGSIVMKQNSGVRGSVTSATGTVFMENNAQIRRNGDTGGNVYTGGFHLAGGWGLYLSPNAVVEGDAYAQEETCSPPDPDPLHYAIVANGRIQGSALAGGPISGSVGGIRTPYNCQVRQPTRTLPPFHFLPENYPSIRKFCADYAPCAGSAQGFQAWADANAANLSGVAYVNDTNPSAVIDLGRKTITGDFTLITNTLIDFANNTTYAGSPDARVTIVSLNPSTDPPAINIKNNFTIPDPPPAVLIYSTGLIFVKNNAESNGAVYASAISIKNNLDITYDPRVERTVGFGPVRYERVSWKELPPA
ncbi:MAG: hypothetical protein C4344_02155 [Acidimicrobiia bacterium]